jgi:phage terminase small subunit
MAATGPNRKLTKQQIQFVKEYLLDLNAKEAAIRAGYSVNSACEIGYQLLQKTSVQEAIDKQLQERSLRTEVTQDRVLLEIARLAFNDPRKAFDENNTLLPIKQWPDEVAACISSIKVNEIIVDGVAIGTTKEIKFWDKSKNLELAGRHLKMFTDKTEIAGNLGVYLPYASDETA